MNKLINSLLLTAVFHAAPSVAGETTIAVASNFTMAMDDIIEAFEAASGHEVVVSYGSSGRLYAQISNGAPFDAFFSADQEKPAALENDSLAVPGSRFTYATGTLVLWSADPAIAVENGEFLRSAGNTKVAMANPRLAPYGLAASQVLDHLEGEGGAPVRVVGENISQAYQFVVTGNVEAGFVALSQVMENGKISRGAGWIVSPDLHDPIRQDALLLGRGKDNAAARELMLFMKSDEAKSIINSYGYRTD